jgi:sigma-B regulation protein RsbU (phosphoserine phosphatase)
MRILVGWDVAAEAELLGTFLSVDDGQVQVCTALDEALAAAHGDSHWDAVLLATGFPSEETGFAAFQQLHKILPDVPFVAAVPNSDVYRIARFLTAGIRGYLIRDQAGDFMFLAQAVIDAAVKSLDAERERFISEKLREEVESVRKLQASVIPRVMDCPPGYCVAGRYEPSQIRVLGGRAVTMAGGDYYDVFTLPDGSLAVIVGDASGHGMKACLSIMTMHTLLRLLRENRPDNTAAFVEQVNRNLCQQTIVNDDGGFITLFYGVLNPQTHELAWTSAGHPVPMLHDMRSGRSELIADKEAPGLPLGIIPDAEFEVRRHSIPPHSRLLVYTDGLVEAFQVSGAEHHEFGEEGLRQSLHHSRQMNVNDALQHLFDASLEHTHGEGRHDDTSVVLLERA